MLMSVSTDNHAQAFVWLVSGAIINTIDRATTRLPAVEYDRPLNRSSVCIEPIDEDESLLFSGVIFEY